ncbi:hypothetical protein VOLCADRAFT_91209 [Volvox carteri f. nagariensis]|uniref:Trafficking protein particle complex subunit 6B n=1 Tax=Volvox carteri f. nagariensis TaxID=3068 RepID=D8TWG8_VOLCA|nr:uncharacterized protein VOLCADRAFT_91209 [Volvox carteri f. nagariensis]EFJ48044.1 hypothetical protein VOLCADRAFT_91209 [Volvox carteri f. nagariensis]|eukprot:XP_002950729.1 hypothetical protein VOLCADRAFT_91209 [Volvox carteri f. nagariensis]
MAGLQPNPNPGVKKPARRCGEVCLELLCVEAVRLFHEKQSGPAAAAALEAIGFRVGQQLAERYTRDKPRLGDTLEIIKFLCKDFWQALFKKQVDNLKTNHRGVYVLQDNGFRWLQRLSTPAPGAGFGSRTAQQPSTAGASGQNPPAAAAVAREEPVRQMALSYLHLPCGVVRGALCHLGVSCTVEADPKQLPSCTFTVRILA